MITCTLTCLPGQVENYIECRCDGDPVTAIPSKIFALNNTCSNIYWVHSIHQASRVYVSKLEVVTGT